MASRKKRPVVLTGADREELVRVTRTGVHPASVIRRAQVLLALDTAVGVVDPAEVIAARLGVSGEMLRLVAKRFAETGGDVYATISRKEREHPPMPSPVTGDVEARLIALACSQPPGGMPAGRCGCWKSTKPIGRVLNNGAASSSEGVLDHPAPVQGLLALQPAHRSTRLAVAVHLPVRGVQGHEDHPTLPARQDRGAFGQPDRVCRSTAFTAAQAHE